MIGERMKIARKAAKLTQKEVAQKVGITESTYCGYETNKRQPDPTKIREIANVLGVSGDYLLELEEQEKPAADNGDELTDTDRQLLTLLKQLTPQQKDLLIGLMRQMLQKD